MSFTINGTTLEQSASPAYATDLIGISGVVSTGGDRSIDVSFYEKLKISGDFYLDRTLIVDKVEWASGTNNIVLGEDSSGDLTSPGNLVVLNSSTSAITPISMGGNTWRIRARNSTIHFDGGGNAGYYSGGYIYDLEESVIFGEGTATPDGQIAVEEGSSLKNTRYVSMDSISFFGNPTTTEGFEIIDADRGATMDTFSSPIILKQFSSPRYVTQRRGKFELTDCFVGEFIACRGVDELDATYYSFFRTLNTIAVGPNADDGTNRYVYDYSGEELSTSTLSLSGTLSEAIQWGKVHPYDLGINSNMNQVANKMTPEMINTNTGTYKHINGEYRLPLAVAHVNYNGQLDYTTGITFDVGSKEILEDYKLTPNLVNDSQITETTKATVDAYSLLNTSQQVYDRAKSFFVDNYANSTELIVTRNGNQLEIGNSTLTIDLSASSAFDATRVQTGYKWDVNPTLELAEGPHQASFDSYSTSDALLGIEFTTGADVQSEQILYEAGSKGLGVALGLSKGNLEVYAGNTTTLWCSTPVVSGAKYYSTIKIDLTNDEIKLYLSETQMPFESDLVDTSSTFSESDWCDNQDSGVGAPYASSDRMIAPYMNFKGTIDSNADIYQTINIADISGSPTASYVEGTHSIDNSYRSNDAIWTIDFTTDSNITDDQVILESGGSSYGVTLGIRDGELTTSASNVDDLITYPISGNTSYHVAYLIDLGNEVAELYVSTTGTPTASDLVSSVSFTPNSWAFGTDTGVGAINNSVRGFDVISYTTFQGTIDDNLRLWSGTTDLTSTYEETYEQNYSALTVKSDVFTGGATSISGSASVDNGTTLNGGTFDCDVNYNNGPSTITNVTCTETLNFSVSGSYDIDTCTIDTVTNSSGGEVTLNKVGVSTITTNSGPSITILESTSTITLTGLIAGSQVVGFETGTTNEVYRNNSTGTTEVVPNITYGNYDYTIMKAGYVPQLISNFQIAIATVNISVEQEVDRAYEASSGLSFGPTATVDISGMMFGVSTDTTVQNWYSFMIESWINESSLTNTRFPIRTYGSDSFSLEEGFEFTPSSLSYLSRDGFRYVNISGGVSSKYCAILSTDMTPSVLAEYEQVSGGTVNDTNNLGNVDQIIQFYGDVTHGNFDYSSHLDFKVQANGYRQSEFDVIDVYGTLEERLYVVNLATETITGLISGDPSPTGLTLTDDTLSPVSWDAGDGAKDYSITITDSNNNTGETILRWLNYNLSLDATFAGKDPFDWPEMVLSLGDNEYETLRGDLHNGGGDVVAGTRVVDISGSPHRDFVRFQADDGTYGTPPNIATLTIIDLTSTNVQVLDNNGDVYDRQVNVTGTYDLDLPTGATGTWQYCINREGYEPELASFDANGDDVSVGGDLTQKLQPDGVAMYQGTSSALLSVVPSSDGSRMNIRIGNGTVTAQQAFDEVEDALVTQDGMSYLMNGGGQVTLASLPTGIFFFMETNVRLIRDNVGDTNATLNAFAQSVDGIVLDDTNGAIQFVSLSDADKVASHQGSVWIDATSSFSGTTYPVGTPVQPVNNLLDAVAISNVLGLVSLKVDSTLTVDEDVSGFRISPGGGAQTLILDASGDHDKTVIEEFFVTGEQNGTVLMRNCSLNNLSGLSGTYRNVAFGDNFAVDPNAVRFNILDCYSSVAGDTKPECDLTGTDGVECNIRNWSGGLQINNSTSANNKVSIDVVSGSIKLDSSVTNGDIVVRGIGLLSDESTGGVINTGGFRHVPDAPDVTQLGVINEGIKKASIMVPHSTDI